MMLRLIPRWQAGDADLDPRLVPLLRMVAKEGSLNRAVSKLRMSYRHAWGLLGKMESVVGQPLVMKERGRGARLTLVAEKLLEADDAAFNVLSQEMAGTLQTLNSAAAGSGHRPGEKPLAIHASHDLALAALRDLLAESKKAAIDLRFGGSLECLAELARGGCDVAGFHLPDASAGNDALAPYRPYLRMRGLLLIRFVDRQQGLMVPHGNPRQLQTLADVADKGARFINRQPESGTRLCIDRLLATANVRPERIRGYRTEEFTHAAVAATVASGMADAGFGIEAAARQQKLDFIPLVRERYLLAARRSTLVRAAAQDMLEALRGAEFRARCKALPGYDTAAAGEIVGVRDILHATQIA
jgi:molybdate transport repressor ModE-like protein